MLKQYRSLLTVVAVTGAIILFGMWPKQQTTQALEPLAADSIIWAQLKAPGTPPGLLTYRAAVPGGWLVCVYQTKETTRQPANGVGCGIGIGTGVTFVPDPTHDWK